MQRGSESQSRLRTPAPYEGQVHLDCCTRLPQFIMDLSRDRRAFFFPHALKTGRESAELIERGLELLLGALTLGDFYPELLIDASEDRGPLFDAKFQKFFGFC